MFRVLTADEVAIQAERIGELYTSKWTVDNLTATLMDTQKGGSGFNEDIARAKAHSILDWLRSINQIEIPLKR